MRIGILTQALHGNYGGILQNYALQQVIMQLGHTPVTIDRHMPRHESKIINLAKCIMRLRKPTFDSSLLTFSEKRKLNSCQLDFVNRHIKRIGPVMTQSDFDKIVSETDFDAFIVGSDQCWRPCYSPNITNYFLDFVSQSAVIKIAYAASFGTDNWEFTQSQTNAAKTHANNFNAISVREKSGIELCRSHLGIEAKWVLDPTMLLGVDGFKSFVSNCDNNRDDYIATYLLEDSPENDHIIEKVKELTNISDIRNNNRSTAFKRFKSLNHYKNITIENWISNIANARFLITDSFHGAVFAILFNIPFVVKLNNTRGNTRLESLLSDFNIQEALCCSGEAFRIPTFDWEKINEHLRIRRNESLNFLKNSLNVTSFDNHPGL